MSYVIYLKIGPVIYEICSSEQCTVRKEYSQFCYARWQEIPDTAQCRVVHCAVRLVDRFSTIEGDLIYQNPERMIFCRDGREYRLFPGHHDVCGIYREMAGGEDDIEIELNRKEIPKFEINLVFLEMLALEKFLLKENALVLHSSYIIWKGMGMVFTAPSGTGKSTQAELWRKYAGAEIINGDRSILWRNPETERFEICGLPFCGSSGINRNISASLSAVTFLTQAPENRAERFSPADSVCKLFGEISINQWNPQAVQKSMDLIEQIAQSVPMIHLACNMEPDAVDTLKNFIELIQRQERNHGRGKSE